MNWIRVTKPESIPLREGRTVMLGDREIAIFNLGDRFAAVDAACPHRGGPLCDGIVTGSGAPSLACGTVKAHAVVCPLHGWKIDLQSGRVLKPDVTVRVDTYDVRIEEGAIEVAIPDDFLSRDRAA